MRRKMKLVAATLVLMVSAFSMLGAGPDLGGLPPQPLLADYFSGNITIQGRPAPFGVTLVACIDDCHTVFQSVPVTLETEGEYRLLEINPADRSLRGRDINFYVVTPWGRIKAQQTAVYVGAYNLNDLQLTFPDPVPVAPPVPSLPMVGDPIVPMVPRFALGIGLGAVAAGLLLLAWRRRWAF